MRKAIRLLFPLFMVFVAFSCAAGPSYTEREIKEFTIREYKENTIRVYAAVRNVLSDEGVEVIEINREAGLIRGKKEIRTTSSFGEFFAGKENTNIRYYDYIITPTKDGSRLVLNIHAVSDKTKTREEAKRFLDPMVYKSWFRAIEEELFN